MDFKLGPQEKFSLHQFLFVNTWWRLWWRLWYKKVTVVNRKNIYTNKPLIITANHQNAAMDALTMVGIQTRQIVWLARADIFKNKVARPILKFFKIMPIYRMRDGASSLGKNQEIFDKCIKILKAKKILALFPEATHWGFRRLRAVQKAAPRIAFMAEELSNYELNTHILPVGIYYQDYVGIRKNLFVNIGEPFPIKEYIEIYKENKNQAFIALRDRIQEEMRALMLDIKHEEEMYDAYDDLRFVCQTSAEQVNNIKGKKDVVRHYAQDRVIKTLDNAKEQDNNTIETLAKEALEYKKAREKYNFKNWIIEEDGGDVFLIIWNTLRIIVGLPVFTIGFFTNYIKFTYIYKFAKKIAKDVQFHNSITFSLGYLATPISYLLIGTLVVCFTEIPWWGIFPTYAILLIIAVISFDYFQMAKKTYHMYRYAIAKAKGKSEITELQEKRKNIIKKFESLL